MGNCWSDEKKSTAAFGNNPHDATVIGQGAVASTAMVGGYNFNGDGGGGGGYGFGGGGGDCGGGGGGGGC